MPRVTNRDRLPRGAVRDLLSLARALYRAEFARGGHPVRLQALAEIGHALREALELSKVEPDTIGHRAAWGWAQRGTRSLVDYEAP